jgi:predicted MFS family arabinose efflux permease
MTEKREDIEIKKEKSLTILYIAVFIDFFAVAIMIPLLQFYAVGKLGMSISTYGLLTSMYGALQLIAGPLLGSLSDFYGRKTVLLLSFLGAIASYFSMS